MSDSPVSDRRGELQPNQPLPEALKPLLDDDGNIVYEVKTRPRLDAMGRPLTDNDLGDLLTPVLNAAKFDPEQLPAAKGADIVSYIAALTGIRSLAKAVKEADAVAGAWSATVADYAAAKAELDAMRRDARTTVMVQANAGKPAALDSKTVTTWRTLTDRVAAYEDILGPVSPRGTLRAKPVDPGQVIIDLAFMELDFDDAAQVMLATRALGVTLAARHRSGLPPGDLPTGTEKISRLMHGRVRADRSWAQKASDQNRRKARVFSEQLATWSDELTTKVKARQLEAARSVL